ncbi:MAG: phage holin family protein [Fimbriimonadaceae bacterium]|nr:phage holin family protein [Fimbriimonadaceae bacterium]
MRSLADVLPKVLIAGIVASLFVLDPSWASAGPLLVSLLVAQVFDILTGILVAVRTKSLCSSASWKGMTKKVATWIVIGLAGAIDPHLPDIPALKIAASFYIGVEGLSVLENAGNLGVPIPKALRRALRKLRDESEKKPEAVPVAEADAEWPHPTDGLG